MAPLLRLSYTRMPSLNDLAVAAFITLLVFGGIYVPRLGDALGRWIRRLQGKP
jgi:Sec-independent protein translocase protein TatA